MSVDHRPGSASEVFATFLRLGLTSFGGPIAHIGYFRREIVARRGWVSEARFGELLGLCQFLPGPASSQLGFSLGLLRAGWPGALAAFAAFTLPSALLLFAFAMLLPGVPAAVAATLAHGSSDDDHAEGNFSGANQGSIKSIRIHFANFEMKSRCNLKKIPTFANQFEG